jgi:hypothetical protein
MKRWIALLAACAVVAGLYFLLRNPIHNESHPESPTENSAEASPVSFSPKKSSAPEINRTNNTAAIAETKTTAIPTLVEKPATPFLLGSPNTPPSMDPDVVLRNMRNAIHQYGSMFGGNPTGTNPEITDALNGGNPREARFINEESGLRINGRGELVDSWGTPFFFHQLSGSEMEIRSAGPDKKMWTRDDLVTK